ncbi:MAG: hypothetical protein OXN89_25005 [Bryobacterales bacterium]|nr:hypothetical protein [Bryobacterales bacterium]
MQDALFKILEAPIAAGLLALVIYGGIAMFSADTARRIKERAFQMSQRARVAWIVGAIVVVYYLLNVEP